MDTGALKGTGRGVIMNNKLRIPWNTMIEIGVSRNTIPSKLLTVLGFVRFLASVSQLLRWLYVLRRVTSYTIMAPAAPL